jgi:phosphate transport system substrate-binding protein
MRRRLPRLVTAGGLCAAVVALAASAAGAAPTGATQAAAPRIAPKRGGTVIGDAAKRKPTISMSGSTSVAPLAALLAQKYEKVCGHCVVFRLLQGGSDVGVADVAHGRVTIGNSSRDPKPTDPPGLVFNPIAHDAICVITNNANKVSNLDQNAVQQIFSGGVHQWNQVPGSTVGNDPIDLFVRTAASGTQDAFQKIFMNPLKVSGSAKQLASNGLVQQAVKSDKDGVGYVSEYFARGVHAVPYKGVACTLRNAKSGQYGGIRTFYMVTRGQPRGAAKRWIRWITHSKAAKKIVASQWVPLK